jgi:pimeloyl-ACP methyl ester carboxylesterase
MSRLTETARRLAGRRRARRAPPWAPEPPEQLPPGCVVHVPGRGELFVRDSGGDGPLVLLLHGWMVSADLNWITMYGPLTGAGFRVLAVDHRGHGRGLRTHVPFRLADCAADAAALLAYIEAGPAFVVGYSMGGPITQLLARDNPDCVRGMVFCATAQEWRDPRMRVTWRLMSLLRLVLGLAPHRAWRAGLRWMGFPDSALTTWVSAELTRGSARDIAEAGRELGRHDARSWIGSLRAPAAVVVTTEDADVPPRKQRQLAAALRAPTFDVGGNHMSVAGSPQEFAAALLAALDAVGAKVQSESERAAA